MKKIVATVSFENSSVKFGFPQVLGVNKIYPSFALTEEAVKAIKSGKTEIEAVIPTDFDVEIMEMPNFNLVCTARTIREFKKNLKAEGLLD